MNLEESCGAPRQFKPTAVALIEAKARGESLFLSTSEVKPVRRLDLPSKISAAPAE